ncbi:DUF3052 family protein [Kitasatospora indigofera]|uniref:DUF3052 family protein n=1 Tax=Kitasatospora indigofera TaxID=67307 RepID=UPI0036CD0F4D
MPARGHSSVSGTHLVDESHGGIADPWLLRFRDGDGDLTDVLLDAVAALEGGNDIWLCTPLQGDRGDAHPPAASGRQRRPVASAG